MVSWVPRVRSRTTSGLLRSSMSGSPGISSSSPTASSPGSMSAAGRSGSTPWRISSARWAGANEVAITARTPSATIASTTWGRCGPIP